MPSEKTNILRFPRENVVLLIQKMGGKQYTEETLADDIALGAPVNDDGSINLFDYAAWLYAGRYNGARDE